MPTHVIDLDLSAPWPDLDLRHSETGVLALVRWHGRPIGLVRWSAAGHIPAGQLRAAILSQLLLPGARPTIWPAPSPLSIVVCTHERPADLVHCLNALLPIAAAGHEVLIVDNAPHTPRTAELVARYPFRYLCEPRRGLNHARNCGLRAASHPFIAFTDDDAVPDPNWVNALAQPFSFPAVGCVTGLVLPLELETRAQELFEIYCAHRRTFTPLTFQAPPLPSAAGGVAGMGANMAFRRDLLLSLGGFDPRLDGGTLTRSGGDTDMFARVLDTGAQIVYTPEAFVWHRHRRDEAELRQCLFGYGVGLYSFLTKRLLEMGDWGALVVAARWFGGPFLRAARRRLQGQATLPLALLLVEAAGACVGPLRFWQAVHRSGGSGQLRPQTAQKGEEIVHDRSRA